MTTLKIQIREYPKDKEVYIEDLTATGAQMLIDEAKYLLFALEDIARGDE